MPPSNFEANPKLRLRVKRASFYLFSLVSSCSNAYFRAYAIIDFLADRLVFLNMVTFITKKQDGSYTLQKKVVCVMHTHISSPYAGGVQVGSPEPPFKINDIHSMHVVEVLVYTVESQLSELQLSEWVS